MYGAWWPFDQWKYSCNIHGYRKRVILCSVLLREDHPAIHLSIHSSIHTSSRDCREYTADGSPQKWLFPTWREFQQDFSCICFCLLIYKPPQIGPNFRGCWAGAGIVICPIKNGISLLGNLVEGGIFKIIFENICPTNPGPNFRGSLGMIPKKNYGYLPQEASQGPFFK